jgi:8-oxo-dGTP diphosphatase
MKREYPDRPVIAVGGVVIHRRRVLLVRRGREPLKGRWSIPGGALEVGERLAEGVRREVKEETGLEVEPVQVVAVLDRVLYARRGAAHAKDSNRQQPRRRHGRRVRYHYVIIDYACRLKSGLLRPASDVLDARWVAPPELTRYRLTQAARSAIGEAFRLLSK